MNPADLFTTWGAAWVTRDPAERLRRFEQCCTENIEFVPPDERPVIRGRAALARHVTEYTAAWPPGVGFELARPPDTHHGYSRGIVRWLFPATIAVGCDIIRIDGGRIASMLVFAEP
ncbi:nuclear transport factor 2 family protein [Nocardia sp. BMG111209]|uniref:nuclear transport factor 2 family protein n=1 Tax=Nocardia sp. BMG111209 TaxID=1160137 RepID=UPI0003745C46|nr:nuclear transport factor 2 family protein [Nocardia sp. BMG111209]